MAITERQILTLKEKAQKARDSVIEAKATVTEVENNIKTYEEELKALGVDPANADEKIQELIEDIEKLFTEAEEIASAWE